MNYVSLLIFALCGPAFTPSVATGAISHSNTVLTKVIVKDPLSFELQLNSPIGKGQIETEYLNDTVQVNLRNVTVYPPKMIPVDEGPVRKVFAYQYTSKLVRCRFSLKGKASEFKGKIRIHPSDRSLLIEFGVEAVVPTKEEEIDEKALYEKVLQSQNAPAAVVPVEHSVQEKTAIEASETQKGVKEKPAKPVGRLVPSLFVPFLKIASVFLLLLICAWGLKKSRGISGFDKGGLLRAIGQFTQSKLGRNEKMIEVVSTHYLDPKKRIAVVRVAGRLLVLGVANESINLITQINQANEELLGTDGELFGELGVEQNSRPYENKANPFEDLLTSESEKPLGVGSRSRIKSRLEGLKNL